VGDGILIGVLVYRALGHFFQPLGSRIVRKALREINELALSARRVISRMADSVKNLVFDVTAMGIEPSLLYQTRRRPIRASSPVRGRSRFLRDCNSWNSQGPANQLDTHRFALFHRSHLTSDVSTTLSESARTMTQWPIEIFEQSITSSAVA